MLQSLDCSAFLYLELKAKATNLTFNLLFEGHVNEIKKDEKTTYINCSDEEQLAIVGYKWNKLKYTLTWLLIILSFGFLRLIFHWKPEWMLFFTHTKCRLQVADSVLLTDLYNQKFVCPIRTDENNQEENDNSMKGESNIGKNLLIIPKNEGKFDVVDRVRFIKYKKHKYIWFNDVGCFKQLKTLNENFTCSYLHEQHNGLNVQQQIQRRRLFGINQIKVPVHSILKLLFLEVLNPFYVFQVFSVSLWFSDEYEQYATVIVLMSIASISISVYQLKNNQKALRDTIQQSGIVTLCQNGNEYPTVDVEELVPGDVIVLPSHGCSMFCDAVLLNGNCIVNEASLTGESVPVTKTALPKYANTQFDETLHARHILYCGTKLIQTRFYGDEKVKAVVIKTGFMTQKGNLVRSIMFPKPVDFKFSEDASKFIMVLASIAVCGFIYTVFLMKKRGEDVGTITKRALDLITIVVPPALPAAMTVGIIYAQSRLKRQNIFCISPRSINISGAINCVCFDKTGTLTEEGLDVLGVVPIKEARYFYSFLFIYYKCHKIQSFHVDPLDVKMFEATGWQLEEPQINDSNKFDVFTPTVVKSCSPTVHDEHQPQNKQMTEVGIIRQFTFSSTLQRMSVVTRSVSAKRFHLYVKGSPEMIHSLCIPSTVPDNFDEVLKDYALKGYRVIGLAHRVLSKINYTKVQRIERTEIECQLTFLGMLVMENRIKVATKPSIDTLLKANIRTIMITGDNILTALSVARQCSMLLEQESCVEVCAIKQENEKGATLSLYDPSYTNDFNTAKQQSLELTRGYLPISHKMKLSVSGKSLELIRLHHPEIFHKLLHQGVVFARMSPEQKQLIIENLQKIGLYVAMCGDGANDCGHTAGISLSEAEASIASPFTSKTDDVSCVPSLIKEGRAALVTSFGMFKYMAIYSMCQFCTVLFLYTLRSNLTDWQFIYIDLFLITTFAALFGRTEAYEKLSKRPPPLSLISATPIMSLLIHVILIVIFQSIAYLITAVQPWYLPHHPDPDAPDDDLASFDNFSIFSISIFQYIGTAIIFSKAAPYRKSIFTNRLFLAALVVLTASSIILVIYPPAQVLSLFEMTIAPSIKFRAMLLLLVTSNFIFIFIAEFFIIDFILSKKLRIDEKNCWSSCSAKYEEICDDHLLKSENTSPLASPMTVLSPSSSDSPLVSSQSYDLKPTSELTQVVISSDSALSPSLPSDPLDHFIQDEKLDAITFDDKKNQTICHMKSQASEFTRL
ncbi:putative cation-transporting ATPase 13A3 [Nymphon striatum]|nr:putative cation-transporting ATPase 13A3 [Nymphon striatum]